MAVLVMALVAAALVVACGAAAVGSGSGSREAAADPSTTQPRAPLRYVALGDSYTIGTSVGAADRRFPNQLVAALGSTPPTLALLDNLGVNGYTAADLIRDELPALADLKPEFVTVLIGVNDVVQGVPATAYESRVVTILDALVARLPADRIVTIAVPDYTVTPAGADFGDPVQQHAGIVANNEIMSRLSAARGITYVDIFDISRQAATDRSLVAGDGLHPSGVQYGLWVERIRPVVERLLAPSS